MKRLVAATLVALLAGSSALAQTAQAPAPAAVEAAAPAPAPEAAPAAADATAPAADPNVYQVLRTGDRQMSCDQLSAEANSLNAQLLAEQKAASKKAGRSKAGRAAGGVVAGGAMRTAGRVGLARFGGMLGPVGFIAAHAVNDAASEATAQAIANGGDANAAPTISPPQQRMNHLLGLYKEKSC